MELDEKEWGMEYMGTLKESHTYLLRGHSPCWTIEIHRWYRSIRIPTQLSQNKFVMESTL